MIDKIIEFATTMAPKGNKAALPCGVPAAGNVLQALSRTGNGVIKQGVVLRSGPGTYDVSVSFDGNPRPCVCSILSPILADTSGATLSTLPQAGVTVLVYLDRPGAESGIILGVVASVMKENAVGTTSDDPTMFRRNLHVESGVDSKYYQGYTDVAKAPAISNSAAFGSAHVGDALPGEVILLNKYGVGTHTTALTTGLTAGPRASVTASLIDDTVRVIGGTLQTIGPGGTKIAYNDNGYITEEETFTGYQGERAGAKRIGTINTISDEPAKFSAKVASLISRIVPRKRLQIFKGFLGDIINIFVASPDPSAPALELEGAHSKDQGLFHANIDGSGRLHVRAANGIILERSDKIPVPKRLRQPWDPQGDKKHAKPEVKLPFKFDDKHPYGRSLQLRDYLAWATRQAYLRLHERSDKKGNKDFYLPDEGELTTPNNNYDDNARADLDDFHDRKAYAVMEPDGSIIFRDAWGSEIIMRGGNIIFNAAGNIEMRTGKSVVVLGGQDVVLKAKDSVDITTSAKDIRLIAKNNLHMRGEGVIVESPADNELVPDSTKIGEDYYSKGIILRAPRSRVLTTAKVTHLAGHQDLILDTAGGSDGDDDDIKSSNGTICMLSHNINLVAGSGIDMLVGEDVGLRINSKNFILGANTIAMYANKGFTVSKGDKIMVPAQWAQTEQPPYAEVQKSFKAYYDKTYDVNTASFVTTKPSVRHELSITYRTPAQYGTDKGTEIGTKTGKFYLYQPAWEFMMINKARTIMGSSIDWKDSEINGTYPWPGANVRDRCYIKLTKEDNVVSSSGIAVDRSNMASDKSKLSEPSSIDTMQALV